MIRLSDLSLAQRRVMVRLDDGFEHEDSVGRELLDFEAHEFRTVDSLLRLSLAEMVPGRRLQFWVKLTRAGRRVREADEI